MKTTKTINTVYQVSQSDAEKMILEKYKFPKGGTWYFSNYSKGKVEYRTEEKS